MLFAMESGEACFVSIIMLR